MRTLVARPPMMANRPRRVTSIPARFRAVPNVTDLLSRLAACTLDVRPLLSLEARRAPPQVQKMEVTERAMPTPPTKKEGGEETLDDE